MDLKKVAWEQLVQEQLVQLEVTPVQEAQVEEAQVEEANAVEEPEVVFTKQPKKLFLEFEDADGNAPDAAFCKSYAASVHVDPAMVVLDHNAAGAAIPLISPPGQEATFESLAATWSHLNPYLRGQNGGVGFEYPWNALLWGHNMVYHWSEYLDKGHFETVKKAMLDVD